MQTNYKLGVNLSAQKGPAVPVPLVALIVLLLLPDGDYKKRDIKHADILQSD